MGIETGVILAYAAAASAAVGVYSAVQQGKNAREAGDRANAMGEYQKQQAEADAAVAASEAQLQARQIRKAGDRQRSEARASLAASGVTLGTGTAELIDKNINSSAEEDALMSIYQGDVRAGQIRQGGAISEFNGLSAQARGKNAQTAANINAGASALSGVGQASRAWNSTNAVNDPTGDFYQRGTRGSGD